MQNNYHNVALIVAGGFGTRIGGEIPKQYLKLGGIPILQLTIEQFINHPYIDAVKVVINQEHVDLYQETTKMFQSKLLVPCLNGGETRQDSVRNGLDSLRSMQPKNILIHDAARPFIDQGVISKLIQNLEHYKAVDLGISIKDTLKSKESKATHNREDFYLTHTPQGFDYNTITSLHEKYKSKNFTDDISLCMKEGTRIGYVESNPQNIKITTFDCLKYGEFMIQQNYVTRVGYGYDIHKFIQSEVSDNAIKLCGVDIPFTKSLSAHSDGDLALHAITDALLGAIGEDDIGMHFPPTEEKWKGADSTIFLEHAYKLLLKKKGIINNVDITIIAEKPNLKNFKSTMRKKIAQLLRISDTQVSVKAKTSEKLGFIGREEGIAASVVCAIMLPK